jgi:hypothetical protein
LVCIETFYKPASKHANLSSVPNAEMPGCRKLEGIEKQSPLDESASRHQKHSRVNATPVT